jgi:hypothetical protein
MSEVPQQNVDTGKVEDEKTEAAPEILGPPSPSEAASETAEKSRDRKTVEDDEKIFFDMLDAAVSGTGDQQICELATKHLVEKGEVDPDAAKETGKLLQILFTDSRYSDAMKSFDQMGIPGRKKEIVHSICMSVLKGHLTANDFVGLVPKGIVIKTAAEMAHTKSLNGSEGVAYYDHGQIILTETALKTGKAKTENGEVSLDAQYFEHLMCHELSHGVIESTVIAKEGQEKMDKQMNGSEKKFSSEMLRMTREILDNADAIKDTQPAYIRFYLETLNNVDRDFGQMPPEKQQKFGSLEGYRNLRRVRVANEIMADYAGIYMKSDGSKEDFVEKSLDMADKNGLAQFLITNLKETGADASNAVPMAKDKIRDLNKALADKTETIDSIRAKYPQIATLIESYSVFHSSLSEQFKNIKGKALAPKKNTTIGEEEFDEEELGYSGSSDGGFSGGNYDPGYASPSKTPAGDSKGSGSFASELGAFVVAFGGEVYEPVAKSIQV